jgi:hypothetical protein
VYSIACPSCGRRYLLWDPDRRQKYRCRACGTGFYAGGQPPESAPEPPPPAGHVPEPPPDPQPAEAVPPSPGKPAAGRSWAWLVPVAATALAVALMALAVWMVGQAKGKANGQRPTAPRGTDADR